MDKKTLYDKAEKALNQAFEAAKKTGKAAREMAGEAAHITKLHIDKMKLEHQVNRRFAELGNHVYEKAVKSNSASVSLEDKEIQAIIEATKKLDAELEEIEANIERERQSKSKKTAPKKVKTST